MKYTIYKTINLTNGKIYIGCHKTKDPNDDYLGSGKHLKHSIEKYGIENFKKEVLYVFDDEASMFAKEKELVTEEFCKRGDTYNICPGGQGGWGYINQKVITVQQRKKLYENSKKYMIDSEKSRKNVKKVHKILRKEKLGSFFNDDERPSFRGKSHSEEHKKYMSEIMKEKQSGEKNSQYGTMWITNGIENKKIKKVDNIPEGWYKGRKIMAHSSSGKDAALSRQRQEFESPMGHQKKRLTKYENSAIVTMKQAEAFLVRLAKRYG